MKFKKLRTIPLLKHLRTRMNVLFQKTNANSRTMRGEGLDKVENE